MSMAEAEPGTAVAADSLQAAFEAFRRAKSARKREATTNPILALPRTDPTRKALLRARFIELAQSFLGVPYSLKYHVPDPETELCCCEGCTEAGRQLGQQPFALDCCGLVRKVARMMAPELGFRLGPGNQAYQYDTLPLRVASVAELQPGDLVFYSGTYLNPDAKAYPFHMTHVEIFVGGTTGEATIGSRERQKVVKRYDSYLFEAKRWTLLEHFYCKLDPWLEGICEARHPELWKRQLKACGPSAPVPARLPGWDAGKYSIFNSSADLNLESGDEADADQITDISKPRLQMASCPAKIDILHEPRMPEQRQEVGHL